MKPLPPWIFDISYGFQAYYLFVWLCPLKSLEQAQAQRDALTVKNESEWSKANPHAMSATLNSSTSNAFRDRTTGADNAIVVVNDGPAASMGVTFSIDSTASSTRSIELSNSASSRFPSSFETAESRGGLSTSRGSLRPGSLHGASVPDEDEEDENADETEAHTTERTPNDNDPPTHIHHAPELGAGS